MKKPLVIGITGGIGSGKSTLAAKLRKEGYVIYDSDDEARKIQNEDVNVRRKIIDLFGNEAYIDGKLNRKKIASVVFVNQEMLKKLTEIVHPEVIKHFDSFIKKNQNNEFIFLESAVLFESGLNKFVDLLVLVTASETERIRRVIARDNISEQQIRLRMERQIVDDEIFPLADLTFNSELEEFNVEKLISDIRTLQTKKGTH